MGSFYFLRIFSVLPRPVSPLVNPPPGGVPTATQKPTERPERRLSTSTHTSKKNAVERPQNAPQRTPAQTTPTQHEPKHRHRTRAAIQDYTLQQPGRSSRPQGSPNGDPQTAPQRAGTPPGLWCSPTDRSHPQRRTGGTEGNRKRPEPKPGALRLIYSFLTGQRRPRTEKLKCKVKSNLFTPLLNRKTAVCCRGAVLGE